nr:hypothetical protein [Polynucleobacter necessarius]
MKPKSADSKIRIAYFSSDFKFHPVGVLMKNIVKMHDRSRFEVSGVFLNRETGDEVEEQFKALFDHCYHTHNMSDQEVFDLLGSLDIDISPSI